MGQYYYNFGAIVQLMKCLMAEDGVGKLMSLGGHEAQWIAKYF